MEWKKFETNKIEIGKLYLFAIELKCEAFEIFAGYIKDDDSVFDSFDNDSGRVTDDISFSCEIEIPYRVHKLKWRLSGIEIPLDN